MRRHHTWFWSLWRFGGILPALVGAPTFAQPASSFCDDRLKPVSGFQGYQPRENAARCEGMFESPISSVGLEVASFMIGELSFSLNDSQQLLVSVPALPGAAVDTVYVRAIGLPLGTYYRMDSIIEPGGQIVWSLDDVVKPQGLGPRRLGLFGWYEEQAERVFVPIVARFETGQAAGSGEVELKLRSLVDLERVRWRVRKEDDSSEDHAWQDIDRRPPRAGETIDLTLSSELQGPLRIDISAKRRGIDQWLALNLRVITPNQ